MGKIKNNIDYTDSIADMLLPRTEAELEEFVDSLTPDVARRLILPTSDIFARYLLSSEETKHLTLSFINAVLTDSGRNPVTAITIKSPFNLKRQVTERETIMDVEVVAQIASMQFVLPEFLTSKNSQTYLPNC